MCIKRSTFNCNGFYITFWCTVYGVRVQNLLLHFPHISVGDGRKDDRMQHVQSLSLCKSHCLVFSKGEHADILFLQFKYVQYCRFTNNFICKHKSVQTGVTQFVRPFELKKKKSEISKTSFRHYIKKKYAVTVDGDTSSCVLIPLSLCKL